jgi:hypothetical protein
MNLMDTIVLPTGAKVPLPQRHHFAFCGQQSNERKFNDDHEEIRSLNELYYLTSGDGYYSELKENVPTAYKKCQNILCAISIYPTLIFSRIAITIILYRVPHISFSDGGKVQCVDGVQSLSNSHENL